MIIALGFAVSTTVLYFLGVDLLVWVNDISIRKWTTFNELLILLESHVGYYFLLLFVLLGVMSATMPMSMIMSVGPIAVVQALLVGIIGFALMMFIGIYVFRIERRLVATLATAMAVGNVTGIVAGAEASKAKLRVIRTGFALCIIGSIILLFLQTAMTEYFGIPHSIAGAWAGSSTVAAVAGFTTVAAIGSDSAMQSYTLVKVIGRDMSVVIWTVLVGIIAVRYWKPTSPQYRGKTNALDISNTSKLAIVKAHAEESLDNNLSLARKVWDRFPRFIIGLLGASILCSIVIYILPSEQGKVFNNEVLGLLKIIRNWFFTLTFLGIGFNTKIEDIKAIGWRTTAAFMSVLMLVTIIGYFLSAYVFGEFWMSL